MAISYVGCNQSVSTGLSLAAATASDMLALLANQALAVTEQATTLAADFNNYNFPTPSMSVPFDGSGQLSLWPRPTRPELDYDLLEFDSPGDGGNLDANIQDISDIDPDEFLPEIYEDLINQLVDKLMDIIENGHHILPVAFENAVYDRARDRVSKESYSAELQVIGEFSRRNLPVQSGIQIARQDMIRTTGFQQLAGVSRDIAIEVYRAEAQLYQAALQLAYQFYAVWGQIYSAWVGAQDRFLGHEIQVNQQRLQRLQALIEILRIRHESERTRLGAVAQAFNTEGNIFGSLVQEGSAIAQRDSAAFQGETSRRDIEARVKIQAAQGESDEQRSYVQLDVSKIQSVLSALSQIGAAFVQALNVGATMSSTSTTTKSESKSCDTQESYSERRDLTGAAT